MFKKSTKTITDYNTLQLGVMSLASILFSIFIFNITKTKKFANLKIVHEFFKKLMPFLKGLRSLKNHEFINVHEF